MSCLVNLSTGFHSLVQAVTERKGFGFQWVKEQCTSYHTMKYLQVGGAGLCPRILEWASLDLPVVLPVLPCVWCPLPLGFLGAEDVLHFIMPSTAIISSDITYSARGQGKITYESSSRAKIIALLKNYWTKVLAWVSFWKKSLFFRSTWLTGEVGFSCWCLSITAAVLHVCSLDFPPV